MRVKVCGIRCYEDLDLVSRSGADAIGLLVGQRHRSEDFLELAEARELAAICPPLVTPVLVTHYDEADPIISLARELLVSTVQVHSDCASTELLRIRRAVPGVRLIRAVHATGIEAIDQVRELAASADAFIIDSINASEDRVGGTGLTHDWGLSQRLVAESSIPVILAGGLDGTNVASAISTVRPYGVDANSRLRSADGFKNREKVASYVLSAISAFVDLANEGESSRCPS